MPVDYTKRSAAFVAQFGTNDAGNNPVGAPQAWLTIAAALADLAANYPPATAATPLILSIEPGTYTTPAFALPPFTFIVGNPDGPTDSTSAVVINLTGNVTLSSAWSTNSAKTGGIENIIFRQTTSQNIDLTMPTPASGNPARTVTMHNVRFDCDNLIFQATSTGDKIFSRGCVQDGNTGDAISLTGGAITLNNLQAAATTTIASSATIATVSTCIASSFAALVITKAAAGLTATFDAVSVPIRSLVTLNGGAVFARASDANGEAYSPTTPGNWSPIPATVQEALDTLATTAGGGGTGTFAYIVRTGNRSSAAWGVAGVAYNDTANTFTDTTSLAGTVPTVVARSFGIPTFSSGATVVNYTNAANVYIAGDPVAGGSATLSFTWALWNAGATRLDGAVNITAGPVGIGTGTTPSATMLQVVDTGAASPRGITNDQYNNGPNSAQINWRKARGSFAVPSIITTADILGRAIFWGFDGANFIESANIRATSSGTIAANRIPSQIEFYTSTDAGPSVLTLAVTINNAQNITCAAGAANFIRASIYENSSGLDLKLQSFDNSAVRIGSQLNTHILITAGSAGTQGLVVVTPSVNTATAGTLNSFAIQPTYNQASGTAGNTDLFINRTQTAVGSGSQFLIDAQVSTVSKFNVTNTGLLTYAGAAQAMSATAIPAGGAAGSGFRFFSTANFGVFGGSGAPTLVAAKGSLYLRSDGTGATDRAFIATDSAGTWTAITTLL